MRKRNYKFAIHTVSVVLSVFGSPALAREGALTVGKLLQNRLERIDSIQEFSVQFRDQMTTFLPQRRSLVASYSYSTNGLLGAYRWDDRPDEDNGSWRVAVLPTGAQLPTKVGPYYKNNVPGISITENTPGNYNAGLDDGYYIALSDSGHGLPVDEHLQPADAVRNPAIFSRLLEIARSHDGFPQIILLEQTAEASTDSLQFRGSADLRGGPQVVIEVEVASEDRDFVRRVDLEMDNFRIVSTVNDVVVGEDGSLLPKRVTAEEYWNGTPSMRLVRNLEKIQVGGIPDAVFEVDTYVSGHAGPVHFFDDLKAIAIAEENRSRIRAGLRPLPPPEWPTPEANISSARTWVLILNLVVILCLVAVIVLKQFVRNTSNA